MTVSATEATFEGFRVTRHNPGVILIWAAVWLVGLIAAAVATFPMLSPWAPEMTTANGDISKLSAPALAAISNAGYAVLPVVLLIQTVLMPALYRAVLRPEPKGFGYLRFGSDELRMFLVALGLGAVSVLLNLISSGLETAAAQTMGAVGALVVSMAVFATSIAITVRLSLVAPITLLRGKISFVEGWHVSARWFWPLLGITVLSMTMAAIVVILLLMIGLPLQQAVTGGASAVTPLSTISFLLLLLLIPLGATLVTTILWAPYAAMCRNLPPRD
ncbi:hypothetical protein [Brevundimonas sp.]|jgi:hypothetical protein|uniref:hypothetical protein n=1 Tax=Brevundimonas sp. TaxID=1871086 RepID=UPI0025C3935B|nr:hypothetical protein [Brevundimonas sp.]